MNGAPGFPPVLAHLDGRVTDLQTLAELTVGAGHRVEPGPTTGQWVMRSPRLDPLWSTPGELHRLAQELLVPLNGLVQIERNNVRLVTVSGKYSGPGNDVHVATVDVAVEVNAVMPVAISGVAARPPAPGTDYLEAADLDPTLAKVLAIAAAKTEEMTTEDMWKVYELIRWHVGGINPGTAQTRLEGRAWFTRPEYDSFHDTTHNPARSGDDARHTIGRQAPPTSAPVTLGEARQFVKRLVRNWRRTLPTS